MSELTSEERATKKVGERLADIIDERLADDDGIWRLSEEDIAIAIEIADEMVEDHENGEEIRDAILIETTCLMLQQRILYREKKGPGSR